MLHTMGKSLMHDPECAPLVRWAFEEYATGRYTKKQLLQQARARGLTNRRGRSLTSQAIGMLLRNQLPESWTSRSTAFVESAAISNRLSPRTVLPRAGDTFWPSAEHDAEAARAPGFPLRGFVRGDACRRGLTGSWSKPSHFSAEVALRERAPGA